MPDHEKNPNEGRTNGLLARVGRWLTGGREEGASNRFVLPIASSLLSALVGLGVSAVKLGMDAAERFAIIYIAFYVLTIACAIFMGFVVYVNVRRYGEVRGELNHIEARNSSLDLEFQRLAGRKASFDTELLRYVVAQEPPPDMRDLHALWSRTGTMLSDICTAAANSVSARKAIKDSVHANIKLLFRDRIGNVRYYTVARSPGRISGERQKAEEARGKYFALSTNSIFDRFVAGEESGASAFSSLLEEEGRQRGRPNKNYREPDRRAEIYYNNFIVAPIFVDLYEDNSIFLSGEFISTVESKIDNRNGTFKGRAIIGFISIDSKTEIFGSDSDVSILEELTLHCRSVLQLASYVSSVLTTKGGVWPKMIEHKTT